MSPLSKYKLAVWFVGGLLCGLLAIAAALRYGGWTLVSARQLEYQQQRLSELRQANRQLTDRLFALRAPSADPLALADLPYDENADARAEVAAARRKAVGERKFLMVTFGANWCLDCRTLHRNLQAADVAAYTGDLFLFAHVDIGKFNRNRQLAEELGVDLSRGIPVAIFFDPAGRVIGTTSEGQLEPSRRYSSQQILRFMRDIAERSRVVAPDAVGM